MQETPQKQVGTAGATEIAMNEYLKAALLKTELLRQILYCLQKGGDLSLEAWSEAFQTSRYTLEYIDKVLTLAQEVFDEHIVQISGSLSVDLVCDEFKCLTWK
ncbi:MAG TPA: hypothetical protein VFA09_15860 [Ktedonobacteraceae bacterium]|nr:hypothetical protein [Ktedonobacteraceae bacterium]